MAWPQKRSKVCNRHFRISAHCAVAIDDFDHPSQDAQVHRFVLSAHKPSVLFIPAGYANGAMNLTHDTNIVFFSTATMEEAKDDDFRYASHHWNIWTAEER